MKAIAISDVSGGSVWSSEPSSWHYSSKRSQDFFHPVSLTNSDDRYGSRPSRVSRSLFGPSDPSESHRLALEEFNSRRYCDRSRWNFDFYQEKPMAGRYDWRKVCPSTKERKFSNDHSDSIWSSSPKKHYGNEDSSLDLKRTGLTWSDDRHSAIHRSLESKKSH